MPARRLQRLGAAALAALAWLCAATAAGAQTLRVATVNNAHMLSLQRLAGAFEQANPGVQIAWSVFEEGQLRQEVSVDVATGAGRFDVVTIGLLEAPTWGQRGWLRPLAPDAAYAVDDLLPPIRRALSFDGRLMAAPFYAESSITLYRRDLLRRAGASLPERPSWDDVRQAATKAHDPARGVHGLCLRGKPGWGENMALVGTMVNTWGGQWFDMAWRPVIDSPPWKAAVGAYVDLLRRLGPPGAVANGYNENLALFEAGQCAIWVDATVAAATLVARDAAAAQRIGWAWAPVALTPKGSHWLWSWALAVPRSAQAPALAQRFVLWATSPQFMRLAAEREGWRAVPPGTRLSTYAAPAYQAAHPAAALELQAILSADVQDPTLPRSPYVGIQYVAIPEFQAIGTAVGQQIGEALSGRQTVEQALRRAQAAVERRMAERAQAPR